MLVSPRRVWSGTGRSSQARRQSYGAQPERSDLLVAYLAERGVRVIGIASGARIDAVRAAGATHVVDRASEDVYDAGLHAPAKPNSTRDPRMISRVFSCTERLPVNVSA